MFKSYTRSNDSTHKLTRTSSGQNSAEYDRASRDSRWGEIGVAHILAELTSCAAQLATSLHSVHNSSKELQDCGHASTMQSGISALGDSVQQQQPFGNLSLRERQQQGRPHNTSSPTQGSTAQHPSTTTASHSSANTTHISPASWQDTGRPPSLPPLLASLAPDIWAVNLVCAWLHGCVQECIETHTQIHTAVLFGSIPSVQGNHQDVSPQQDIAALGSPWRQTQSWPNPPAFRPPHTPHGAPKRSEPEHQQHVLDRVQAFLQQAVASLVAAVIVPGLAAQVRAVQTGLPAWSKQSTGCQRSQSSQVLAASEMSAQAPTASTAFDMQNGLESVTSGSSGADQRHDDDGGLNGTSWSNTWFGKQQQPGQQQVQLPSQEHTSPVTKAAAIEAAVRELVRFDNFDEGLGGAEMLLEEEGLEWEGAGLSADGLDGGSEVEVDVDWEPPIEQEYSDDPHGSLGIGSAGSSSVGRGRGGAGRSSLQQLNFAGQQRINPASSGIGEGAGDRMSSELLSESMDLSPKQLGAEAKTAATALNARSITSTASLSAGMVEVGTRALSAAMNRVSCRVGEGLRQQQAWRLHHLAAFEWTNEHLLMQVRWILGLQLYFVAVTETCMNLRHHMGFACQVGFFEMCRNAFQPHSLTGHHMHPTILVIGFMLWVHPRLKSQRFD